MKDHPSIHKSNSPLIQPTTAPTLHHSITPSLPTTAVAPSIHKSNNPSVQPTLPHSTAPSLPAAAAAPTIQQSSHPIIQLAANPTTQPAAAPALHHSITPSLPSAAVEPWPEPVDGKKLLTFLVHVLKRFVVLPMWAAETLALWIVHTFAFHLRDVSTYVGIESPEHRCGKSTLVTVLSELAHRSVVSSNISPPAFFRVIEDFQPTLFIDEADTFLPDNQALRGILNSGYTRKTAYVMRVANQASCESIPDSQPSTNNPQLVRFSCWCPKVIARIGRLPITLADRFIVIRMQRKTPNEECERLRNLDTIMLRRQCARFVQDHAPALARA